MTPDFDGAMRHALERLERELAPEYQYHSLEHTRDEVLPAVERLATAEGTGTEARLLLRTAAVYHDIGFLTAPEAHEVASARLAAEVLPGYGYTPVQIAAVCAMILATRLPQTVTNLLEGIVADADLDVLGREDFLQRNADLQAETTALGGATSDEDWYQAQLRFMQDHRYWTESARRLRDPRKAENMELLARRLASARHTPT